MLKKYVAIVLMSFSAILLVGHDIIPHHHEDSNDHHHSEAYHAHLNDSHSNEHHSDSKNTSNENGVLGDLLSNFVHTSDFSVQESSVKQIVDSENERIDNSVIVFGQSLTFCPLINTKSIGYNYKDPDYIPPHCNSKGLRAPPVFFS